MFLPKNFIFCLLLSISRAQKVSSKDSQEPMYFVLSVFPTDSLTKSFGFLSHTGHIAHDPFNFDVAQTVFAVTDDKQLVSYNSSVSPRTPIGIIGAQSGVENALMAAVTSDQAENLAPINTDWAIVADYDRYDKVEWSNEKFPNEGLAYFCVTGNGAIGEKVYAVFSSPPRNCQNVTLDLGIGE